MVSWISFPSRPSHSHKDPILDTVILIGSSLYLPRTLLPWTLSPKLQDHVKQLPRNHLCSSLPVFTTQTQMNHKRLSPIYCLKVDFLCWLLCISQKVATRMNKEVKLYVRPYDRRTKIWCVQKTCSHALRIRSRDLKLEAAYHSRLQTSHGVIWTGNIEINSSQWLTPLEAHLCTPLSPALWWWQVLRGTSLYYTIWSSHNKELIWT